MEKPLYMTPQGLGEDEQAQEEFEFELTPDEGEEVAVEVEIVVEEFGANLVEGMDKGALRVLSSDLCAQVDADISSRKDWAEAFTKGLEVLGMKYEERTEPWEGACGVYSTVLAEAAIRFQSEAIMETFPAAGPVKVELLGAYDKKTEEAGERVKEDMNYQLTCVMQEYRPEHERMLYSLGLAGAAFKKVFFDTSLGRQTSLFVPAEDVIIPFGASSAQTAERVTHIMRKTKNEVRKLQVAGFYVDEDIGDPAPMSTDIEKKKAEQQGYTLNEDNRYQLLEIQVDLDLPGHEDPDGIALPYIVTIDKGTNTVLSIYRNWEENDYARVKRQHFVQYTYIPGFGAYGMGLIHLIGGYARAGTSIIRELIDAGQLSNLPGGMKTRGLRIKGDDTPIAPGEFRDVDVASGTLRDNIMPLPYKEPSQVLFTLLNQITEEARRLGAISDMNISDMSANAPVGTTLALLERTLKTMSAVQARVHASMRQEFKLLAAIIRDHTPEEYPYETTDNRAKRLDYDMVEVIPVSDPNSSTMAQRIMQYQAALQLAQGAPQIYDLPVLHRQMLEVLGIKNGDKLIPASDEGHPKDPISENMGFLTGKPTKAFMYQDHEAHIAVHSTFMQDPMIAAQIGQGPMAQQIQAAIGAHIADHLAFTYRSKIEQQLGAPLPDPHSEIPEEIEAQLSRLVAQAAAQLLVVNKGMMAQQQAMAAAQDPIIQMQQAELQLKSQEMQIKGKKVDADIAIAQAKLQLEAQQAQITAQTQGRQQQMELQFKEQVHRQNITQRSEAHRQKVEQARVDRLERAKNKAQSEARVINGN